MYRTFRNLVIVSLLCLLVAACGSTGDEQARGSGAATPTPASLATATPMPYPTDSSLQNTCPKSIAFLANCQTPESMRRAYGLDALLAKGYTGKGQTIIDIVSFGSPTLQKDIDAYDAQFGLPPITIQQISPLNEPESDPHNDKSGWADETTLDVEIIHALAPEAGIVVLTSPVAETEGTVGLPEFRQLLQYAVDHKLGTVVSQSWGVSEKTLEDADGRAEIQKWDTLYKQFADQKSMTILTSSGDNGATDYADLSQSQLASTPTTSFPADDPWVTAVGGTSLLRQGAKFSEVAWDESGGGFSEFYPTPDYQKNLSSDTQSLAKNRRGVPDISGNADPRTGLAMYENGSWSTAGGTSASAPMWAALVAIGNQMAGHSLGFINPALYKLAGESSYAQNFHDIVVGDNSVSTGKVQVQGFKAVSGWDAITGLGSPNAAVLLPALVAGS